MTEGQRLPFEEFKSIYSRVPRLGVDLIIQSKRGILFTKRTIEPFNQMWHFPGGSVFLNESIKEAVKRIAKEEVGLEVEIKKLLGYMEFPHEKSSDYERHTVTLAFLVKALSKEINLNKESDEFKFFKEVPENTVPQHKEF